MSLESSLKSLLNPLVGSRVYPDVAPDTATFPLITYQQVGGEAGWYLEKEIPSHKHARVQVNVWSNSRAEANTLARQLEAAICHSAFVAEPYGALTALYEPEIKKFGTRQDFGIHYPDP